MLLIVVQIRPATFDASKLPFLISLRSPDTVIAPSGNATRAAISSGIGVSGSSRFRSASFSMSSIVGGAGIDRS
jgi:hypothetical protein